MRGERASIWMVPTRHGEKSSICSGKGKRILTGTTISCEFKSEIRRFVSVPELMQQFRQVADVQTAEMLKLPVPKMEQGRPVTVSAPTTPELKRFVDQLVKRTEKIKSGKVDPRDDNMLKITTEGRKAVPRSPG